MRIHLTFKDGTESRIIEGVRMTSSYSYPEPSNGPRDGFLIVYFNLPREGQDKEYIDLAEISAVTTLPDSEATLAAALKVAAEAHHALEVKLGRPDPDWPQWYARHMLNRI